MVWEPAVSEEVVNTAWPETRLADPRNVDPSRNVMVPVGRPRPARLGAAVAVKVTGWPVPEGLGILVVEMNVPPVFSRTETLLLTKLATTRSGAPSELMSATARFA